MNVRLKVLVSAYACNPYKGSEEGVGWGWINAIAKYHDLWVITAKFHRKDIEKAISNNGSSNQNIRFHYVPEKPWHYAPTKGWRLIENSTLKPLMNWAYLQWEKDAFRIGSQLHDRVKFDLVHLITYVGFRFPGYLWKLNIPFIWGPIGGLENTPWKFLPKLGLRGCIYYTLRNIRNSFHRRFLSRPKKAFKKARGSVIAATGGIRDEIYRWYGAESIVIPEVGPPPYIASNYSKRKSEEPLKLAWSGLHLPGKALPFLLHALNRLSGTINFHLDILGTGPCTNKWQRLADKLKIGERCTWHGWLPRNQALEWVHQAHIFVITSIKDLTSTVLLEALSLGVPVICLNHCGFADIVTSECGVKIPVGTARQIQADLAAAITKLNNNEEERRRLARGALQRITEFSWENKAEMVNSIYQNAVKNSL
jgi:glycosyltransferase involved in cell wall biosynthesis